MQRWWYECVDWIYIKYHKFSFLRQWALYFLILFTWSVNRQDHPCSTPSHYLKQCWLIIKSWYNLAPSIAKFIRILHLTNCKLSGIGFMSESVHASRTFRSGLLLLIPVIHEAIVQTQLDKNINIVNLEAYSRVPAESLACMACALLDSMEVSFCYQTARMEIVNTPIISGDTIFTPILNISSSFIHVCQFQTTTEQKESAGALK